MKRRLPFIIFAALVLGVGAYIFFVVQDGQSKWKIPVIEELVGDESTPDKIEPGSDNLTGGELELPSNDATKSSVLVNKQHPLDPIDYTPVDLTSAGGGQQLRAEAASALAKMFDAAKSESLTLQALSGYRSYSRQKTLYNNYVAEHGQAEADTFSAKPGYSEHQTGWAIDIGGGGCGIEQCFADTAEGKWVAANAHKYGFIIRYPKDKQSITGYIYEPWHIRYVGVELATEIFNDKITLEEFFDR